MLAKPRGDPVAWILRSSAILNSLQNRAE